MTITFEDYEHFIYVNTGFTKTEAREIARQMWNKGIAKYDALDCARLQERRHQLANKQRKIYTTLGNNEECQELFRQIEEINKELLETYGIK